MVLGKIAMDIVVKGTVQCLKMPWLNWLKPRLDVQGHSVGRVGADHTPHSHQVSKTHMMQDTNDSY